MAQYTASSPYANTSSVNGKLNLLNVRSFPHLKDDLIYEIDHQYNHRPDLLAYDLYNNSGLWWVFAQRNPNTLIDPVFDFITGIQIYLPQQLTLQNSLEF